MRHTIKTVDEVIAKFWERGLLVPKYVADEEIKNTRYHDMLRVDIREFVSFSACRTLEEMIAKP